MKLTIGYYYGEKDAAFVYSFKVHMFMKAAIDEFILRSCGLDKGYPDVDIWITITTKKNQEKLEVQSSQEDNSNKEQYDICLPYKTITESKDPLKNYFHYIVEGLRIILKDYDVFESQYDYVKEVCVMEISGNPVYELSKEEKKMYQI